MKHIHKIAAGMFFVVVLFVAGERSCFAVEPSAASLKPIRKNAISVTIRPEVEVASRLICVGDVATISCSDTTLRDQLKKLDLEEALSPGERVTISAAQIRFRMQIAGIEGDRISIQGRSVEVTGGGATSSQEMIPKQEVSAKSNQSKMTANAQSTSPPTKKPRRLYDLNAAAAEEGSLEREVIQAAQSCVLNRLPWPADTIDIRLAQPVPLDVRQAGLAEGYECTADLRSAGSAVGRVQVRVVAETSHGPNFEVPIVLDVRHFDKVVVTSRALERGHVITTSDLYVDRQDVTDLTEYCSDSKELVGLSMKRSVRALQPLRMSDLDAVARTESSVLVKRRDQVKMVARVGAVSVTAMGEALQDGRLGETIRLRNIETNSNVLGRVTRSGEVEISF